MVVTAWATIPWMDLTMLRLQGLSIALFTFIAVPLAAQSPNTASVIVVVVDQTGAGVKDAKVSVANTATGVLRVRAWSPDRHRDGQRSR